MSEPLEKYLQGLWFSALLGLLLSCLAASWLLQAQAHYGYGLWYEVYDIRAHIDRFGPQNRHIQGLETLEKPGHVRLFNAISQAVHEQGDGLADIRFDWRGRSQPLLHNAEVVHLQDVANLIEDRKSTRLNSSHVKISYAVFCLKKKTTTTSHTTK